MDFPVLVRLNPNLPGFSYATFSSPTDGADLRFTSPISPYTVALAGSPQYFRVKVQ